ncbi:cyclic nucleotide-binding domain-containing protein [Coraliomargarita algicola]|uniref:Cyclic nucleotide-binding domain-containing protein n=1 Tax=Coraliomargarita algicola TaxID=3092156 RepID=A0ABZ0RFH0_9BACT|nr:cyclic nucleotide-binding domain-containing protein [Coraliomargarita sp. J2-16]WPJ94811.1 cyclic nucleotide-binding domain-containing protein [Coraliomargarita sp. J2-16]
MLKKILSAAFESRRKKSIEEQLESMRVLKVPFLEGADDQLISELATALEPVKFPAGKTIFREGEPGDSLFLIVDGTVRVSSEEEEIIAELGVGGCFGEGALLEGQVRAATVVAVEELALLQLKRESYEELATKFRKLRYRLSNLHKTRKAEEIENSIECNLLKNAPFLAGAGGGLINELAHMLERKHFAKGNSLIREGADGKYFFLIEEGMVSVSQGTTQLAELGPGTCIGEGALFSGRACSATVKALTDTSSFVLKKEAFRRIIARYPVFGKRLHEIHEKRNK